MDPTTWGIEIWEFFVRTFNQFSGPYAEEFGLAIAAIAVLGLLVKFVIVPLKRK